MLGKNYTKSFVVDRSPEEVFDAINNVRGWWSEAIAGNTDQLGAEWDYHYQDVHRARFKITEFVPGKKVVWHCVENYFNFVADKTEWTGTDVVFEISRQGSKTAVRFTHVGLVPAYECYNVCSDAWGGYVGSSLRNLITTGKGQPNPLEGAAPPHQEVAEARARLMAREG
ncbi:MAG TPA: SRPBCC domain-containing protein [Gemmatimonadales bacterium]|nr:SRPBCC domain-containing protein [Gemmatimonadales bacterium]